MMGLQFENLVCNNVDSLLSSLGLSPDEVIWSATSISRRLVLDRKAAK